MQMQAKLVSRRVHFQSCVSSTSSTRSTLSVILHRREVCARHRLETLCKATASLRNDNPKHSQTEVVLDRAEEDLRELCTSDDSTPESWAALDYLVGKRRKFSERCDLEDDNGPHEAASCDSLVRLGDFARELMTTGSVRNFRDNLLIMQRAEERRAAAVAAADNGTAVAPPEAVAVAAGMSPAELHERADWIRLFRRLDTNQDGEICMLELLDGMETLGAVLTDNDIRQIRDALDASDGEGLDNGRNRLDVDDFISVCATSSVLRGVAVGAGNANFLRHAAAVHGHAHPGNASQQKPRTGASA